MDSIQETLAHFYNLKNTLRIHDLGVEKNREKRSLRSDKILLQIAILQLSSIRKNTLIPEIKSMGTYMRSFHLVFDTVYSTEDIYLFLTNLFGQKSKFRIFNKKIDCSSRQAFERSLKFNNVGSNYLIFNVFPDDASVFGTYSEANWITKKYVRYPYWKFKKKMNKSATEVAAPIGI